MLMSGVRCQEIGGLKPESGERASETLVLRQFPADALARAIQAEFDERIGQTPIQRVHFFAQPICFVPAVEWGKRVVDAPHPAFFLENVQNRLGDGRRPSEPVYDSDAQC